MGAGNCDAAVLNVTLAVSTAASAETGGSTSISSVKPDYCVTYHRMQGLADDQTPMYAGDRWVEAADYPIAIAAYEAAQAAAAASAASSSRESTGM